MSTEKFQEIINQYFDNELTKAEEVVLFTRLSQNEEARNYFKEMNLLKNTIEATEEEYPQKLDLKILSRIKTKKQIDVKNRSVNRIFNYISYVFALILLIISLLFYNNSIQYKNKLELTYQQMYMQNQMIQVLFNTLPQVEVSEKLENTIIVTPKM